MAGVRILVSLEFEGELPEGFAQGFAARVLESRQDPGCIEFEVARSVENPSRFFLIEHWESQQLLNEHWQVQQQRQAQAPQPQGGPRPKGSSFERYDHRLYRFDGLTIEPLED